MASKKLAILFPLLGGFLIYWGLDLLARGFPLDAFIRPLGFGVVILFIGLILLRYNIRRNWEW